MNESIVQTRAGEASLSPLVSVVMPCYNVAHTLQDAVQSVLQQSYQKFELILVDDGSTDNETPALCDSFLDDPRVRVIHQRNEGLAGARNTGMAAARGDYIALLDSDDLYEIDKLATHVEHLELRPAVGLSFSYSRFLDEDGKKLPMTQGARIHDIRPEHVLCRNPIGNGSAAVLRRQALRDVAKPAGAASSGEYFDSELRQSEDVEFWFRLISTTDWSIEGIAEPLTLYRLNSGGLSADTTEQLASWEVFLAKAADYAQATVEKYGADARAYQLRYLARRSVMNRDAVTALRYLKAALQTQPRILLQEPVRTLITLFATIAYYPISRWWPQAQHQG